MNKVNNGTVRIYIVRENPTAYHVSEVDKAAYLDSRNGTMEFTTDDAAFALSLNAPVSGVNLALPSSKTSIYLDGTATYQCLNGYVIQKKENSDSRSFKEYVIVPEIGIVARASAAKTGFVNDLLRDNEFRLAQVGDDPFKNVLSKICDNLQANYYDGVASTSTNQRNNSEKVTTKGGGSIPTNYGNTSPCAPTSEPGIHVVQKGETLYGLSKKYGIQVAQLQNWNSLANTNVISVCQRLRVKEQGSTTSNIDTQTTEKGGSTTTSSAGYWTSASTGEHQVRAGETVASLAKMYGFTEERFRKMNGLSPTENVLQGQRLRTNDCNCPTLQSTTQGTPQPYDQATETLTTKDGTASNVVVNNQDVYYRPISVHLVKNTDTFFSIAKQYNTSVERIWELNGMTKNDKLTTDQRIYVQ